MSEEPMRTAGSGATRRAGATSCDACDAVCCRLVVVVDPGDDIPSHLTARTAQGLNVMARGENGWCIALDKAHMRCSIYDTRPDTCRRFSMGGPYCREVRRVYDDQRTRGIPLTVYP